MRRQVRYRCSGRNHSIRLLSLFIACVLLRQTLIRADADQVQSGNGISQQERKAKSQAETDSGQSSAESPQLDAGGERPSSLNTTVVVTAARMDIPLTENPASTTVVSQEVLRMMPKAIAAEEALQLVPGVKVDNQANGERVHLSIRGVGLLTERGVRGIKVLLDGVPLNDPTGFAPDLFDVDWATIQRIEVIRGPASALYGGAAAGGVLNIQTRDGGTKPVGGDVSGSVGSYGSPREEARGTAIGSTRNSTRPTSTASSRGLRRNPSG